MNIFQQRYAEVKAKMKARGLKGVILFPSPNLYYMTGFQTHPGERLLLAILPTEGTPFFIAPRLFAGQIKQESVYKDIINWTDEENAYERFKQLMGERGLTEGQFAIDDTTFAFQLLGIMQVLPKAQFVPMGDLLLSLRVRKSVDEIEKIRAASKIADDVIDVIRKNAKPGMTEIEIAAMMEFAMRKSGSSGPSFETIVGSGPNSALPHYNAGDRKVNEGEFIVLDFGALYKGYCSDTTRTVCMGTPTAKMVEVYNIVREAQELGVKTARPGLKASEVDKAVRKYIADRGYGEYFTHRTGHGLGMEVHEEPYISGISETILEPGMVFSIEPGIYIEGEFGVRIEDIVYVTENGCERFNHSPREMICIGK